MTYYINRSGQQYGPYTVAELQNMIAQGQISATDNAWGEGMASWASVSEVLASASGPPPQQPQQPAAQQQYPPQQQYQPQPSYQAPQPQYQQPQQPSYGGPISDPAPYAAQSYGGGYAQPVAGAVPPGIHWFVLLLLGAVTCGVFMWVWIFVEAGFVKKIDPRNKSMMWLVLWLVTAFATVGVIGYAIYDIFTTLQISLTDLQDPQKVEALGRMIIEYFRIKMVFLLVYMICAPLSWVFMLVGFFSMRSSIQRYYNSAEPIGLRLSGVMTFFFNILYFQYHFRRIARWKQTGQLI